MTILSSLCAALWLLSAPAPAQFDESPDVAATASQPAEASDADLIADFKTRLQSDPRVVSSLAQRVARSSLGPQISKASDEQARLAEIENWIKENPNQAAGLGLGLSKDDDAGTHDFENALTQRATRHLEANPNASKGIFGRLRKTSRDSHLLNKDEDMSDEEKREIQRTLFEGQGSQSNKITTIQEKPGPGALNSSYYDRLGKGNLHGYSPELQALQSALNARRAPGAPKLIETGKLDYETLSYPGYAMRHDITALERRLRLERNYAWAKALGLTDSLSQDLLLDPNFEAELQAKASAAKISLNARFSRRLAALERAAQAARAFDRASLPAKDPLKITRALLLTLGSGQKEAARWITAASLEEELQRLESLDGFLSPEMLAMISQCPVSVGDQSSYLRRGQEYAQTLRTLKENDERAVAVLESDDWLSQIAAVEKLLAQSGGLRGNLTRDIGDYVQVPYRFAAAASSQPRWRQLINSLILKFLPRTAYGRQLAAQSREKEKFKDVFLKIATGDVNAAHAILIAGGL